MGLWPSRWLGAEALGLCGGRGTSRPSGQARRRVPCPVSQVEISRRVTLEKLPPVLVLHLKRFVYEKTGGCQKLAKNIEYPVDLEISRGEPWQTGPAVLRG